MKYFVVFFSIIICSVLYTQSPYQNILISSSGGPEEPTICINPKNTNQIAAGSNIDHYYYSTNGGFNWTGGTLTSSSYGVWGDPIIASDTLGNFYYFHLSNPSLPPPAHWIDRIVCQKSTNSGATWSDPGSFTGLNGTKQQDKEGVGIDWTHGTGGNTIYVTWTQFDKYYFGPPYDPADSSNIYFAKSTDGGNSFSPGQRINQIAGDCRDRDSTVEGAVPCVGPNGEVYVGWSGVAWPNSFKIFFTRSTDGGNSWLVNNVVAGMQRGGWDYVVNGIYRNNGLPCTLCDISSSPYRGTIYINYTDSAGPDDHDVMLLKSTNGGLNWSNPIRVNDDPPGNEQFFSWMAIDQVTGFVYIVYYDRRNYIDNSTDVFLAHSTDGGNTWINERISSSPFQSNPNTFFGDYCGISAYNGIVRPIWTRMQGGALSIWTAIIDFPIAITPVSTEIPASFNLYQNFPNPFNPVTKIRFSLPNLSEGGAIDTKLEIYNSLGKQVVVLLNKKLSPGTYEAEWNAELYASGIYFYSLEAGNYLQTKKLVLIK